MFIYLNTAVRLMIGTGLVVAACYLRSPFVAAVRSLLIWGIAGTGLLLALMELRLMFQLVRHARETSAADHTRGTGAPADHTRGTGAPADHTRGTGAPADRTQDAGAAARTRSGGRGLIRGMVNTLTIALALLALGTLAYREVRFRTMKRRVLAAPPERLARLGEFVMVGYRDADELRALLVRGVGGVYVTHRNVAGKTAVEARAEHERMQKLAGRAGRGPLFIATDQEGGPVNHLYHVLPGLPPLAELPLAELPSAGLSRAGAPNAATEKVREYARTQARGLRSLGVNVNFAPVLDLLPRAPIPNDKLTRIHKRALSRNPHVVGRAGLLYSRVLEAEGVLATAKHFPGLGRVSQDTHIQADVSLATGLEELERRDWLPFREVLAGSNAFLMLAHVKLTALDASVPASYSAKVVRMLRERWKFDGVIVTDDISMAPVAHGPEGPGEAAVRALLAGVDLILIAYDTDLFYEVMDAILRAETEGRLDARMMEQSRRRLARARKIIADDR